ncbi:MAG TPA: FAD-binding oxidoreductase [Candidatus Dormibacteraeota bacterium]|nr:FAD-binding oxidoreductase [Candidatus Dormibacteraeota bacterium]
MEAADVVIVGGGVMGCSLAYHLAARKVDVVLLERDRLGSGSTARNAGGVRQQFSSEVNVRIGMRSVAMLNRFEDEVGVPADFRQVGYLMLLTRPSEVEEFGALMENWHRLGLAEARWVGPEGIGELVPALNCEDVLGATFCPTDGIASPDAVTMGYAAAARRLGARLREDAAVTAIGVSGGRVNSVRTAAGEISTRVVFDCGGPWSRAVGEMAGVEVPVDPYRRHIWVTDHLPEVGRQTPMTVDFTTSFYFHPEGDGVLFGMSDRDEEATFSTQINEGFLERVIEVGLHRLPALERAGIRTAWAGLYEVTPDHQGILGQSPEVAGFWCACGFSGHGFMQAPAVGEALAQTLVDGSSAIDLSPLAAGRFAAGRLATERNVI